ncbi:abscisic acid-insensitive 5-like protein 6 [Vitis vinifera]|uniref:Abscisic acid-insensitive 5-like protein 6 n=1 Tax=Vitis vinifera TaxID=29760 RepID=A0A438FMI9_VITVI|nr:abscisic acid-insensitive 5-like protein 6 [Vitis vinifera]
MNFKNFSDMPPEGNGGKPLGNFSLTRQPSIYSLTIDEFQNSLGGVGKDFGSMNMDELLKNIWTAEETQNMTSSAGGEGSVPGGNLQRQGSLTLPRTISQKTVDEVWKDLLKENSALKEGSVGGPPNLQQRQPTLGEMTLEEFLVRVGVVREDAQPIVRPNNSGFYGLSSQPNHAGLGLGFQQSDLLSNSSRITIINNSISHSFPSKRLWLFSSPMHLTNTTQLASSGVRGAVVGIANPTVNNGLVQNGGLQSGGMAMIGLGTGAVLGASGSPASHISSDVIGKSNVNTSSLSPAPYVFNGSQRGRKPGALEKVVERRQRRMIKNRESAARSRARKQAYSLELEMEVAKLKEANEELQKKQADMEVQKNQILETIRQRGGKRLCLRRTLTGPW